MYYIKKLYWFYLILFILIVLTPEFINQSLFFLKEDAVEEITIFFLLTIAFLIYLWKDVQLKKHKAKEVDLRRESNDIAKDLQESYSYIGAINRKFDILKSIVFKTSEIAQLFPKSKDAELFVPFISAIKTIGKKDTLIISFINIKNGRIEKEIKPNKNMKNNISTKLMIEKFNNGKKSFTDNKFYHTLSSNCVNNIVGCISIAKNNSESSTKFKNEDLEMLQALATQALILHKLSKEKK